MAFTAPNAYAVALWAIKFANQYFDEQAVDLFRQLSTHDGVTNYKSNLRTWVQDGWRYHAPEPKNSHYALDYRVVLHHYTAIQTDSWRSYDAPGGLDKSCHEVLDDIIAVFGNLGFHVRGAGSRARSWTANGRQEFRDSDGRVLIEAKAFKNGNLHFRFLPDAIKALNIEAGRLLGWLRSPADVVSELGYTATDAERFFGSNHRLTPGAVRLLGDGTAA